MYKYVNFAQYVLTFCKMQKKKKKLVTSFNHYHKSEVLFWSLMKKNMEQLVSKQKFIDKFSDYIDS